MTRADARLDVMLRHLGAAYYESLHGRAARSDLARVLDAVEAYLDERPLAVASPPRRVGDVMTTSVVSVIPNTPAGGDRRSAGPVPDLAGAGAGLEGSRRGIRG
jgi:hypothetical protein